MFSLSLSLKFPDAQLNESLLGNVFDSMQLPCSDPKDGKVKLSKIPHQPRCPIHKRVFLTSFRNGPSKAESYRRSRDVSDPQLISSTNYMRESWYLNFGSAHTEGNIATLSIDNVGFSAITATRGAPDTFASRLESDHSLRFSQSIPKNTQSGHFSYDDDKDSVYSLESADPDAHTFLLSIPIIPQIKLERKATVRNTEPQPLIDLEAAVHKQSLLSPCIQRSRTPARTSSHRHSQFGTRINPNAFTASGTLDLSYIHRLTANDSEPPTPRISRRLGSTDWSGYVKTSTAPVYRPSVSEPMLNTSETYDDTEATVYSTEGLTESAHRDIFLSMIDEGELDVKTPQPKPKPIPVEHSKCNHRRSLATNDSVSSRNSIRTVADKYGSLRLTPRKSKIMASPLAPNSHDVTSRWAPENGQIIIKVFVPSTDDIWKFRVPHDITLFNFTSKVTSKLGFPIAFSGSCWDGPEYYFRTDEKFSWWVQRRVRFGRNLPIVAQVVESPGLC